MSAVVLPFPGELGRRAWQLSEQESRPLPPVARGTLYVRQSGRVFFLSPWLEDLGSGGAPFTLAAPSLGLGDGGQRDNNERTWRAWMIGWCEQRGLEAIFHE